MMNNKDRNITEEIEGCATTFFAYIGFIFAIIVIAIALDY